jgi:hypothetical protein
LNSASPIGKRFGSDQPEVQENHSDFAVIAAVLRMGYCGRAESCILAIKQIREATPRGLA